MTWSSTSKLCVITGRVPRKYRVKLPTPCSPGKNTSLRYISSWNLVSFGESTMMCGVVRNLAFVMIFVKRDGLVVALNQATARSVVTGRSEGETGILGERSDRLNQALAESGFANNQSTIMILNRASDDFRGRGRIIVDQDHQWNIQALIAANGVEPTLRRAAPVIRDD